MKKQKTEYRTCFLKYIIALLTLLYSSPAAYAQASTSGAFLKRSSFPGGKRTDAVAFAIGSKGYLGTGRDSAGNAKSDFWEFDPATNTWTQKASFGGGGRNKAAGFAIGNKGYIIGGISSTSAICKDMWEYNPFTNNWTQKANLPGNGRSAAVGLSLNGKGYISCGWDTNYIPKNDLWQYDTTANSWTQKTSCTGSARYDASGFVIGNLLYITTGNLSVPLTYNDCWAYDPSTDSWTQKATFGSSWFINSTGFSIGGKGYIACGLMNGSRNFVWEYDPVADTWIQKAHFIGMPREGAASFSIGNRGYIGTGYFNTLNNDLGLDDFWEYDPNGISMWRQRATDSRVARYAATNFCIGGTVYMCTGTYGSGIGLNDVVSYDSASNTWGQVSTFGNTRYGSTGFVVNGKGYMAMGYEPNSSVKNKNDLWEFNGGWNQKTSYTGTGAGPGFSSFSIGTSGYVGLGSSSELWEYNTLTNAWTQKASLSQGRSYSAAFSIGNKGYVGTGKAPFRATDFWEYNPATNNWTQKASLPGIARESASGFSIGNKGYIALGYANEGLPDVWEYDTSNNSWSFKAALINGKYSAIGVSAGNKAYIGGGGSSDFWEFNPSMARLHNISSLTICPGDSITIRYTQAYSASSISFQLSNASGSFSSPVTLASKSNVSPGYDTIRVRIPSTSLTGNNYQLRMISSIDTSISISNISIGVSSSFTANKTGFCPGDSAVLTAAGGSSFTYQWLNNNTAISSATGNKLTVYNTGSYRLITVNSISGCRDTSAATTITRYPKPSPGFTINNAAQCLNGNSFVFTDTSSISSGTYTRRWYFSYPSSDTSNLLSPAKTYADTGSYRVLLMLSSNYGCIDSVSKPVRVNPHPALNYSILDSNQCYKGNSFQFFNYSYLSSGTFSVLWKFGDNSTATTFNATKTYSLPGSYQVKLITSTNQGCMDSIAKNVHVFPQTSIGFAVNDTDQCRSGHSFVFNNTSSISSGTFSNQWWFTDGITSTQTNPPAKTFLIPGTHGVRLITTTNKGCLDTLYKNLLIYPQANVSFNVNNGNSQQCLKNNSFGFNNNTTVSSGTFSSFWHFGDTSTSAQKNPFKSYTLPGTFTVKLTTTTNNGCLDSASTTVLVTPQTNIAFSVNDSDQCKTGNNFIFSNGSTLSSGTFTSAWHFGDNSSSVLTNPSKSYITDGYYPVRLITTTNHACRDTLIKPMFVYPQTNVSFTVNDSSQCKSGHNFMFTNSSSISSGTFSSDWNFGDNTGSTFNNPDKSYSTTGVFVVKVVTTSDKGCKDSLSTAVIVYPHPVAAFSTDSAQCFAGNNFVMNNSSSGSSTTYNWSFGNSTTSALNNPSVAYASVGTYPVQLTVTDANGCTDSLLKTVRVKANPATPVLLYAPDTMACSYTPIILRTSSTDAKNWLRNGTPLNKSDDSLVINNSAGTYSLQITNAENCTAVSGVLNISFKPQPAQPVLSISGSLLSSSASTGNQWYNSSGPISGQNGQTFTASVPGNYYTIVTLNGCSSLPSVPQSYPASGVQTMLNHGIALFPNPAKERFSIRFSQPPAEPVCVILTDVTGKEIIRKTVDADASNLIEIAAADIASGTYLLTVQTSQNAWHRKVLLSK